MRSNDTKEKASTHIDYVGAQRMVSKPVVGTIKLYEEGCIVLIPTPSKDPNDPLNLPTWHKWLILIIVGLYAATGNLMVSGISAILPIVGATYHGDSHVNDLATWPAFYMGVGNLLAIPVAHAIGRRPVYLLSTIVLSFGCLWCASSGSLTSHIAGRNVMSIAAGQAEAFMSHHCHVIAWFCALQSLGTASLIVASSYVANDLGWRCKFTYLEAMNAPH
ncbi:major facilitator superfamily domain-containing protein [Phaeosphaeriaceae sp. PMI808]|nr:major facilitator superfamily domain-containing protein [Phaeosphaeriaceae sp. PMI808]